MGAAEELITAVEARLEGTPYRLQRSEDGFDVGVDIVDASYWSLMYRKHLEKTWTYRVRLDEASRTMSITDDSYELQWRAGADVSGGVPVPSLGARLSRAVGRLESKGFERTYAVGDDGTFGKVVDYTFDAAEGRRLIREPAKELGWDEAMGTAQRIGLVFALVGGIGALVTLVVLVLVLR